RSHCAAPWPDCACSRTSSATVCMHGRSPRNWRRWDSSATADGRMRYFASHRLVGWGGGVFLDGKLAFPRPLETAVGAYAIKVRIAAEDRFNHRSAIAYLLMSTCPTLRLVSACPRPEVAETSAGQTRENSRGANALLYETNDRRWPRAFRQC